MSEGVKATVIGAVANLILAGVKFVGGLLGNSTALIADAVHSLSDLLTDGIVLFTHQIGRMPADPEHPYGHGRAETIGTTLVGAVIILAGIGIGYEVWHVIQTGSERIPTWMATAGAAFSILINEGLFRYTRSVGEKISSPVLVANAWHHRSDAISSIAALVGIIGAMAGVPIMDPLAGGVVALMIVKVGVEIVSGGFRDLMDTALHQEQIDEISKILDDIPDLIRHHNLRTRKIGGEILMDLHIQVDTDLTVTEGHKIAEMVRRKLIRSFQGINDVLVHVDGEDDSDVEPIYSFTRESLESSIDPILASHGNGLKRTGLRVHHLKGKNMVDLFLHGHHEHTVAKTESLIQELKPKLQEIPGIDEVRIYLDFDLNRGQSQSQK